MDDSIPTVTTTATAIPPVLDADNLIKVFTHFLSFDVADGAASAETIIAYWNQVAVSSVGWVEPRNPTISTFENRSIVDLVWFYRSHYFIDR